MKRISLVIITLLALMLAVSIPASAKTTVEHLQVKGPSAFAEWEYVEGDIHTFVTVLASDEVEKTGARGNQYPWRR